MSQQFGNIIASELYCPHCKLVQPVRERLLLVLLDGELYEYVCARCGASLAKRTVTGGQGKRIASEVFTHKQ